MNKDIQGIVRNYNENIISLKERAIQLTKAKRKYYKNINRSYDEFGDKYSDLFTLDKVYENNIEEQVNIEITIVVNQSDQHAINYLLKEKEILNYVFFKKDDYSFYRFFYSVLKTDIINNHYDSNDKNQRDRNYEILDPNKTHTDLNDIQKNDFIIGLTPIHVIFRNGNPVLEGEFAKLDHSVYLALNNGGEIYRLNEFRANDSRGILPKFHEDLQKVFRSSWEANIARILNYNNVEWEFEKDSFLIEKFPIGNIRNSYTPDFFLNNNVIIETKGFWDYYSINQVHGFKENIKDYTLKIIDGDMYYSLIHRYKNLIPELITSDVFKKDEIKIPAIQGVALVGIRIKERIPFIKELNIGDEVYLKRDKNNQFDENAISVINRKRKHLGFISKEWASMYAEKLDLGMEFEVIVKSKEAKVIYLSIKRTNSDEDIFHDFLVDKL